MLTDMEDRWSRYYTYQKEYGTEAANKQFPELKNKLNRSLIFWRIKIGIRQYY